MTYTGGSAYLFLMINNSFSGVNISKYTDKI